MRLGVAGSQQGPRQPPRPERCSAHSQPGEGQVPTQLLDAPIRSRIGWNHRRGARRSQGGHVCPYKASPGVARTQVEASHVCSRDTSSGGSGLGSEGRTCPGPSSSEFSLFPTPHTHFISEFPVSPTVPAVSTSPAPAHITFPSSAFPHLCPPNPHPPRPPNVSQISSYWVLSSQEKPPDFPA